MAKTFETTTLQGFIDVPQKQEPKELDLHNLHNSSKEFSDVEPKTLEELEKKQPKKKAPKKDETAEPKKRGSHVGNGRDKDKTERFNMAIRPSLFEDLKALAQIEGVYLSTLVHNTLEALVTENRDRINKFNKITKR